MRRILNSLLVAVFLLGLMGNAFAQPQAPSTLDPRRFDAWTVEYEPFRLLIETAVEEYITLNESDMQPIAASDLVIAVRSKSGQRQLYQIRYGTQADGFLVLHNQEVKWVLGATLAQTISEKEKYYHLDTQIPFEALKSQPEIDYLDVESFWTHTDLQIGMDRLIYLFNKNGGITVELGNELLGRPYGTAGFGRFGVITPMFKMGVQLPMPYLPTGYVAWPDDYTKPLNGGIGAFGAFRYKVLYGELFFQTMEGGLVDGTNINYIDLGGIVNLSFSTPVAGLPMGNKRFMAGAIMIRLGGVIQRIDHQKYVNDRYSFQSQSREDPGGSSEKEYTSTTANDDSGVFFRVDYTSPLIDRSYPQHQAVMQYAAKSLMMKYTYNFNQAFALPVTLVAYMGDNEWTPTMAFLLGVKLKLNQGF